MAKNIIPKTPKPVTPKPAPASDTASQLKAQLMSGAIDRIGRDDAQPVAGPAHVLLVLANRERSPSWDQWKARQREMFEAGGGSLRMKLGIYGEDDDEGMRRRRISTNWMTDADAMDGHMDRARAQCACGCFVISRVMLQEAVKMNADQPMRCVVLHGDMFHDSQEDLDASALAIDQLQRAGTRIFLVQQGNHSDTARRLQFLARITGAAYFKFDEHEQGQKQYAELLALVSAYATGGEVAIQTKGGQTATLLLEYLHQERMPILEPRPEPVPAEQKPKRRPPL
jgi:hypothetical protein